MRSQGFDGQFETNLVIALAGSTVADGVSAVLLGHVHQAFADKGTGKGSAQQILAFIPAVGLEHFVSVFLNKFFPYIQRFCHRSAGSQGFLVDGIKIFRLAQVHCAGNDLTAIVFLQPGNNNGRIQSAGISKNYFFYIFYISHRNAAFLRGI